MLRRCALLLCLLAWAGAVQALQLTRLDGSRATLIESHAGPARTRALPVGLSSPLGSLWKLYVHAYLLERGLVDPGYQCSGHDPNEVYCCDPGERITREQALVRSCGLYYAPARHDIEPLAWREFWSLRRAPAWLRDLSQLQPDTQVPVHQLLKSLAQMPRQLELRRLLLDVSVQARSAEVIGHLGGQLRVKTYSWFADRAGADRNDPRKQAHTARVGGFAGWLVDGTPVWAAGEGGSQQMLARDAAQLGQWVKTAWVSDAGECVDVGLFERYPIRAVERAGRAVPAGVLQGEFEVVFANGQRLSIVSEGELVLSHTPEGPVLSARLSREEYVARVLDREAAAEPPAAARALAISIRSYLQQHAARAGECLQIADSSAQQRVAPRPASAAARAVVAWTADLVLEGTPVNYHLDSPAENRLSWLHAVQQAESGARYDQILRAAFARGELVRWQQAATSCTALPAAASWLHTQLPRWRQLLDREPGHAEVRDFEVCRLASGKPHVDRARSRIFVRGHLSLQERLDLTHEYLHLAFAAHPAGQDENFIESLARRLLLE